MSPDAARTVPCPSCRGPSLFSPGNRWRPFCSERCAGADLGAWASEAYCVPAPAQAPPPDDLDAEIH
ncbi:MAG TPA: DNA gyrase inhibitor YacG [Burkholderiaceae bacterium]|nr:DNA gyrase inhibitor YacG [Burkholderiaceae bacterium]